MKNSYSPIAVIAMAAALSSLACGSDEKPRDPDGCEGSPSANCATFTLTVLRSGPGAGTVASTPTGIDCGATCSLELAAGATVQLTATPDESSRFVEWKGACTGTSSCQVTVTESTTVEAVFARESPPTHVLAVEKTGDGTGRVRSLPAGIDCGSTCSADFDAGATVALTATPGNGSSFAGWSGACSGTGTCTVTMSEARSVTARFAVAAPTTYRLSVSRSGTGSGTVESMPAGIDCGSSCSAQMPAGTVVTLTATPGANSTFTGWSGACSGSGTCSVTMDRARNVVAGFAANTSGLLEIFGDNGGGCVWLDPDSAATSIGVIPYSLLALPSGSIRVSGAYVTPTFGPWPSYEPWFAAFTSSGQPENAFGIHSQIKITGSGTADHLGVTSAGTLISVVDGAAFRFTENAVGRVLALPTDLIALTGSTGDDLVAANEGSLYRVTGVVEAEGGHLDATFGAQGRVRIVLPAKAADAGITGGFAPMRVLVDAEGRTYVVGTAMEGSVRRLLVLRYDANGSLDTTFEEGVAILPDAVKSDEVDEIDAAFDAAKSTLVIVAEAEEGIVAYRLLASGIDTTFGSAGKVQVTEGCSFPRVAVLGDGRTMVGGTCFREGKVRRLLANGQLDTGYHTTGERIFPQRFFSPEALFVGVESLAVTSSGHTLVLLKADVLENPRAALCKLRP